MRTAVSWVVTLAMAGVSIGLNAVTVTRNGEYRSEETLLRSALERYPTPVAHHQLGELLLKNGSDRQEALAHLRLALPGAPRAHFSLGVELYNDRQLDEAIAHFQAFVREQPRLAFVVQAHGYMGNAYARQEKWPEAINEFREILKITPFHPIAERSLAEALFTQRAFEEAVVHYRAYLQAEPGDSDAINRLGIALASTDRLDEAIVMFRLAITADPGLDDARKNLAQAEALLATRPRPAR